MAPRSVTLESMAGLCERAVRACTESKKTVQETRDSLVTAKADASRLRHKADADDRVLLALLAS